jgi:hypothetical protein
MPPNLLSILGRQNVANYGIVEAYIYRKFFNKHSKLAKIITYVEEATPETFDFSDLLVCFGVNRVTKTTKIW